MSLKSLLHKGRKRKHLAILSCTSSILYPTLQALQMKLNPSFRTSQNNLPATLSPNPCPPPPFLQFVINESPLSRYLWTSHGLKLAPHSPFFRFVLFTLAVHIDDNIGVNDTNENKIKAGLVGVNIAKKIGSEIRKAVGEGSLSFKVNGNVLLPDKKSLNISEPERTCATGQAYREGFCGKLLIPMADPDLQITGGRGWLRSSRSWDKGGGGVGRSQQNNFFFQSFMPQFGLKIRGGRVPRAPSVDPPLYTNIV